MAFQRCDVHGKREPGRLVYTYPAVVRGTDRRSRRLRLCLAGVDDLLYGENSFWLNADDDDLQIDPSVCNSCAAPLTEAASRYGAFCTAFYPGDDRREFFATLCQRCADTLADTLKLEPSL